MNQEFLTHNWWLMALAVGSGVMLVWPMLMKGSAKRASVSQATMLMNQRKAIMIDVRDLETAQKTGLIASARSIEIKDLKEKAATLSKNKEQPIIVACQTGQRAGAALTILKAAGYTELFVLDGGVNAWVEAGLPIKKPKNIQEVKTAA
jgi:rhodanese-related sulfurtransferase